MILKINTMYVIIILTWNLTTTNDRKNHRCHSTTRTLMTNIWKFHPLIKIVNNTFIDLPAPSNISSWWNFGSLLGIRLILQILTGLFLAILYTSDTITARRQSWLNYPIHTCKWSINILHLPIYTCRMRPILWVIYFPRNMKHQSNSSIHSDSHSICRICPTMRTNIILRSNSHHQPPFSNSINRHKPGRIDLRGLFSR